MATSGIEGIHWHDEDQFTKEELDLYSKIDLEPGDRIWWRGEWVTVLKINPLTVRDNGRTL